MIKFNILFFKSQKVIVKYEIWTFAKSTFNIKNSSLNFIGWYSSNNLKILLIPKGTFLSKVSYVK